MKTKLKFNLLCGKDELRPILNYVFLDEKNIVATDAHVLGCSPTDKVFFKDFIKDIPKEGVLIHKDDWSKIIQYDEAKWKVKGEIIELTHAKKEKSPN